jgi:hypothetical protein
MKTDRYSSAMALKQFIVSIGSVRRKSPYLHDHPTPAKTKKHVICQIAGVHSRRKKEK